MRIYRVPGRDHLLFGGLRLPVSSAQQKESELLVMIDQSVCLHDSEDQSVYLPIHKNSNLTDCFYVLFGREAKENNDCGLAGCDTLVLSTDTCNTA